MVSPGVGKTHLAISLGTEAIVAGSSVYFVTVQDLVTQFSRARDENKLKERMSLLAKPKLLILDDDGLSVAGDCVASNRNVTEESRCISSESWGGLSRKEALVSVANQAN